jgi:hypothetical protein
MVRKVVNATVAAALCIWSVTPAMAQQQNYVSAIEAPRGATGTVNLRLPLGVRETAGPTYGFTFGIGKPVGASMDGHERTRQMRLADLRFNSKGQLHQAKVASFDLANLDATERKMGLTGEGNTLWIVVGLVAAGVAICLLADCFEGDDDDEDDSSSD